MAKKKCPHCGKEFQNLPAHIRGAHPVLPDLREPDNVEPVIDSIEIPPEEVQTPKFGVPQQEGTGIEGVIGRIIYDDVVQPICSVNGIKMKNRDGHMVEAEKMSWDEVQEKQDYFAVAGKIVQKVREAR